MPGAQQFNSPFFTIQMKVRPLTGPTNLRLSGEFLRLCVHGLADEIENVLTPK